VPIGFLTVLGLRSGIGSATMLGFVFSGSVESVQYVLGRVADIDDILLNTTGALLGAVCAVVLRRTATALRRRRGTGSRPMAPSRR
jgi:glycopeptide antibiotics resistance protein